MYFFEFAVGVVSPATLLHSEVLQQALHAALQKGSTFSSAFLYYLALCAVSSDWTHSFRAAVMSSSSASPLWISPLL